MKAVFQALTHVQGKVIPIQKEKNLVFLKANQKGGKVIDSNCNKLTSRNDPFSALKKRQRAGS